MFPTSTVKNSLLYKFLSVNILAVAMFAAFLHKGWVQIVFTTDISGLTSVMSALFVVAFVLCTRQIWIQNGLREDINQDREGAYTRYNLRIRTSESLTYRVAAKNSVYEYIKDSLLLMGMIGTGIGIYVAATAMAGMDPSNFTTVSTTIKAVIGAVGTKFFATMTAAAYMIWVSLNHLILTNAGYLIIADMLEIKEDFLTRKPVELVPQA